MKMTAPRSTALVLILPLIFSSGLSAQDRPPTHPLAAQIEKGWQAFQELQKESQKRLAREATFAKNLVNQGDTNRNGVIDDGAEREAIIKNKEEERGFALAAKGALTEEARWERQVTKFKARFPEFVQAADANGDGKISQTEMAAFAKEKEFHKAAPAQVTDPESKGKALAASLAKVPEWLAALDKDHDGKLSPKELDGKAIKELQGSASKPGPVRDRLRYLKMAALDPDGAKAADMDGDGRVTDGEFSGAHAKGKDEKEAKGKELLKGLDGDGDGKVSQAEKRMAAVKRLKAKGGTAIPGLADEKSLDQKREKIRDLFSGKKPLGKEAGAETKKEQQGEDWAVISGEGSKSLGQPEQGVQP